jgi:hypothetical protein
MFRTLGAVIMVAAVLMLAPAAFAKKGKSHNHHGYSHGHVHKNWDRGRVNWRAPLRGRWGAVAGGAVAGTAMAKVDAGDGRLAATYGSAASGFNSDLSWRRLRPGPFAICCSNRLPAKCSFAPGTALY